MKTAFLILALCIGNLPIFGATASLDQEWQPQSKVSPAPPSNVALEISDTCSIGPDSDAADLSYETGFVSFDGIEVGPGALPQPE